MTSHGVDSEFFSCIGTNIALNYALMSMNECGVQLELRLPVLGGRRLGAGRRPGPRPRVRHRSRDGVAAAHPALVTLKVRAGLPSLRRRSLVQRFEHSLLTLRPRNDFRVVEYSIQSNHAHFVIEATNADELGRGMKALGARFARVVNRVFASRGTVLRDRYHLRILRTPREVRNALAYVLLNVRKHRAQRGLATPPRIDPASSGRWFAGWAGEVLLARDPPVVSAARSWLLRAGWLRWGRVDLGEIVD
jgi:REP-associated tyrosine transposase